MGVRDSVCARGGGARGLILGTFLAFASALGPGRSMDKITHAPSRLSRRAMQIYAGMGVDLDPWTLDWSTTDQPRHPAHA